MRLTLRTRLAVISALVFGLLLAALSVVSYRVLARWLDADVTLRLAELTDGLHGYLRFDAGTPFVAFDRNDSDQTAFVDEATRYYRIYDVDTGQLVVQSDGFAPLGLLEAPGAVAIFFNQPHPFDVTTEYGRLRISNSVIPAVPGHRYLLQVGVPLTPIDAALRRYRGLLIWWVPPAFLVAVLIAWWLSGFALMPLSRVAAAAREIDVATLDRRLPVRAVRDELDDVVRAFNETLDRLEAAIMEMRQFSGAVAHELRTPLAALRGEIELALRRPDIGRAEREVLASQVEEIDRLKRLIDHILTLARAESGQIHLTFAPVDIGALAASLVDQLEPVAQARGVALRCVQQSGTVVVDGDAGWIQRLVLNLLDNAIKFSDGRGDVVLEVSRQGGAACIEVRDAGIGMSPDVARHVFNPFFRADPARSSSTEGAGLGLSLVKWIVHQHRGSATVQSRPGHGSVFTILLPRTAGRAVPLHASA